jgi:hypothetical protein
MTRSRAMLDVSYAGSPIVGELAGGQGAFGDGFETGHGIGPQEVS